MIRVQVDSTIEATALIKNNLDLLGRITTVQHERNSNEVEYKTVFRGEKRSMEISSGFSSGYRGEGSKGLFDILILLGADKNEMENLVFNSGGNTFSFEVTIEE